MAEERERKTFVFSRVEKRRVVSGTVRSTRLLLHRAAIAASSYAVDSSMPNHPTKILSVRVRNLKYCATSTSAAVVVEENEMMRRHRQTAA